MIKNKKADIADWIMTFFLYLIIILFTIIIFSIIEPFEKARQERRIIADMQHIDNNMLALNFLRTPYEGRTMGELLVESSVSNNYADFNIQTYKLLEGVYGDDLEWEIKVNEKIISKKESQHFQQLYSDSVFHIPTTVDNSPLLFEMRTFKK